MALFNASDATKSRVDAWFKLERIWQYLCDEDDAMLVVRSAQAALFDDFSGADQQAVKEVYLSRRKDAAQNV